MLGVRCSRPQSNSKNVICRYLLWDPAVKVWGLLYPLWVCLWVYRYTRVPHFQTLQNFISSWVCSHVPHLMYIHEGKPHWINLNFHLIFMVFSMKKVIMIYLKVPPIFLGSSLILLQVISGVRLVHIDDLHPHEEVLTDRADKLKNYVRVPWIWATNWLWEYGSIGI